MASEGEKQNAGKGFGGLSSLVSDVDGAVTSDKQEVSRPSAAGEDSQNTGTTSQSVPTEEPEAEHQPYQQVAQQPSGGSNASKWLLGIGAVVGVFWLLSSGSGNKNAPTSTAYQTVPARKELSDAEVFGSPPNSTAYPTTPPTPTVNTPRDPWGVAGTPGANTTGEELAARMIGRSRSQQQVPQRPSEDKPPVGTNHVLGAAQIRYCLSEEIRLGAAKEAVNKYIEAEVDRFNSLVADFNSRCSEFRYRRGMLESVRSEVESNRSSLEAEGIALFRQQKESRRKEQRERVASANVVIGATTSQSSVPEPASPTLRDADTRRGISLADLSGPELQSIESACSTDKYVNGPAAYKGCIAKHLISLQGTQRRPDLSGLSSSERQSIESACSTDKYVNGPAAYNTCLRQQLAALGTQNRRPDLSRLSAEERQSIESACSTDKYVNGPAAYNGCLVTQLRLLEGQASRPNLSHLSRDDRRSIESACSTDKYVNGPAAYNACLARQLSQLRN